LTSKKKGPRKKDGQKRKRRKKTLPGAERVLANAGKKKEKTANWEGGKNQIDRKKLFRQRPHEKEAQL